MKTKFSSYLLIAKAPYKTVEHNGWVILIGRSAEDNDVLSLEIANPSDFWIHVADYPGSHVVVRNPEGVEQLPEEVLQVASRLAVQHSKGKGQPGAAVVVGKAGDLSKPEGAAIGELAIRKHQTILAATQPAQQPPAQVVNQPIQTPDYWYALIGGKELERAYGLPQGVLKHMIEIESRGNPNAKSQRGARGLFQIMPPLFSGFTGNPLDPVAAAHHVAQDLRKNFKHFGNMAEALAAHNWGRKNVIRHGLDEAPPETRKFLKFFKDRGIS